MSSGDSDTRIRSTASTRTGSPPLDEELPVTGVVNRVKVPNVNERSVVVSDPSIKTVMLSIDSARKLVFLHDETAQTYFREDQTVITTTTTHDDTLKELDWLHELDIVRRFGPDFHIPTEYSVYRTMSPSQQYRAIVDCMEGTEWFTKRVENHSIEVLVQAKGWLPWHLELCRPTIERLGESFVVFYAAGYKNRVNELNEDLKTLVSVLKPSGILLIGNQSVRLLDRAPPQVVGAAGGRWRRKSGLVENEHDSKQHEAWKRKVEQKLSRGQAILGAYN